MLVYVNNEYAYRIVLVVSSHCPRHRKSNKLISIQRQSKAAAASCASLHFEKFMAVIKINIDSMKLPLLIYFACELA